MCAALAPLRRVNTYTLLKVLATDRSPLAHADTATHALFYIVYRLPSVIHIWQSRSAPLYTLFRSAFGGPSPAGLTAYMARSRSVSALDPHSPTPTQPCPGICLCPSAECAKPNVLRVGPGRTGKRYARQTRVGDRHAPTAGCGDLGRQLP